MFECQRERNCLLGNMRVEGFVAKCTEVAPRDLLVASHTQNSAACLVVQFAFMASQ